MTVAAGATARHSSSIGARLTELTVPGCKGLASDLGGVQSSCGATGAQSMTNAPKLCGTLQPPVAALTGSAVQLAGHGSGPAAWAQPAPTSVSCHARATHGMLKPP